MRKTIEDVVYCLRSFRRTPGITAVILLTLALGIGANTAIFSIVDGVLLRPLPFHDPQQLVRIVHNIRGAGLKDVAVSVPEMDDLVSRSGVFADACANWPVDANLTGGDKP